jgi:hypothetical protein
MQEKELIREQGVKKLSLIIFVVVPPATSQEEFLLLAPWMKINITSS